MDIDRLNLLGASISIIILITCSLIFISRLSGYRSVEYYLGILLLLTALPMLYLLYSAIQLNRPVIYYMQISIMIFYLFVELLLDYILKINFRSNRLIVVSYVTLFFAGTGGMIGIASHAGKIWTVTAIGLFIIMAILTFVQHLKTGM